MLCRRYLDAATTLNALQTWLILLFVLQYGCQKSLLERIPPPRQPRIPIL